MRYKKNNIVLIEFPYSDLQGSKLRPALVLATPSKQTCVLCQITTKKRPSPYQVPVQQNNCDGNIQFDSYISVDILFTAHTSTIRKTIGSLRAHKIQSLVQKKLRMLFL